MTKHLTSDTPLIVTLYPGEVHLPFVKDLVVTMNETFAHRWLRHDTTRTNGDAETDQPLRLDGSIVNRISTDRMSYSIYLPIGDGLFIPSGIIDYDDRPTYSPKVMVNPDRSVYFMLQGGVMNDDGRYGEEHHLITVLD